MVRESAQASARPSAGEVYDRTRHVEVLGSLPEQLRAVLVAEHGRVIVADKDQRLFQPGDSPSLLVVLRGRAVVMRRPAPEVEIELFSCAAGDVTGELSLVLGHHINEARAVRTTLALRIDGAALRSVLGDTSSCRTW